MKEKTRTKLKICSKAKGPRDENMKLKGNTPPEGKTHTKPIVIPLTN